MASKNLVSTGSKKGLLSGGTNPLFEPMLNCHQQNPPVFIQGTIYLNTQVIDTQVVFEIYTFEITAIQYIPRNMHTVFALLCFVVVIHWLFFPYPSGLLHWHCGNLTIAPVPAKQPWWIWINTSCEFIMNDCITTTKQSTTKPCAYLLGYTVFPWGQWVNKQLGRPCIMHPPLRHGPNILHRLQTFWTEQQSLC